MIVRRIVDKENLISFGFAIAAIVLYGYQFNNGDQEEFLPYVYRILDARLYPGDFLVDFQNQHFNIRYITAYFLAGGAFIFGLSVWVFIIHFFCLFLISKFLTKMAIRRSPWNPTVFLPSLLLLLLSSIPVGGNTLFDVQFTPTMPALALGCFALERFDMKKYTLSMLLCGFASCFQLLIGLHLMILLLSVLIFDRRALTLSSKLKLPVFYVLTAAPMLFPILYRQFFIPVIYDKELYFNLLFIFRNGHHYSPMLFPLMSYFKAIIFIMLMVMVFLRQTSEKNGKAPQFMFMVFVVCISYSIGFEIFRLESVAKMQWFKSTIWLVNYSIPVVSGFLADRIRKNIQVQTKKLLYAYTILLFLLFNSALFPLKKIQARYRVGNYRKNDLQLLHEWIRNNLPDSAVVLSFPSDDALRCETQRSSPITYKAIVHEPDFMLEWYRRIRVYYGLELTIGKTMNELLQSGDSVYHSSIISGWNHLPKQPDCLIINSVYYKVGEMPNGQELARFGSFSAIEMRHLVK